MDAQPESWSAEEITYAVINQRYPVRAWLAVPNVSWGWGLDYEADLLVISKSGWAQEIEVKISRADLRADKDKQKFKKGLDGRVKKFWYAVPEELVETALQEVQTAYGILAVSRRDDPWVKYKVEEIRSAQPIKHSRKTTEKEIQEFLRLGTIKYWGLLEKYRKKFFGAG